jgi:hypothetical protein
MSWKIKLDFCCFASYSPYVDGEKAKKVFHFLSHFLSLFISQQLNFCLFKAFVVFTKEADWKRNICSKFSKILRLTQALCSFLMADWDSPSLDSLLVDAQTRIVWELNVLY